MDATSPRHIEKNTRNWVEQVVIGHHLCPFAANAWAQTVVHVSDAQDLDGLLTDFGQQLERLLSQSNDVLTTTLIVVPGWLNNFEDYLDALTVLEQCLEDLGLHEEFQLASFHPQYCFAEHAYDDPANGTNRSPWPTFHLLRSASVAEAIAHHPDPDGIPMRNAAHFRSLGADNVTRLLRKVHGD